MSNGVSYIIVQAGGKGSRLGAFTYNKPKALVPVENLPLLFHLAKRYPESRFIIIADYKKEVMHKYLKCYFEVDYAIIDAHGSGTCAGISQALKYIPDNTPFMLIWSDLLLSGDWGILDYDSCYVGISQSFECRWSYKDGLFIEKPSIEYGVAGLFIFGNKRFIDDVPKEGEFVAWLSRKKMRFLTIGLAGTREFGTLKEYEALKVEKTRPFNRITEQNDILIKEGVTKQGLSLANIEAEWYREVIERGYKSIPTIFGLNPIRMAKINGKNVYEYKELPLWRKKDILDRIIISLKELHALGHISTNYKSIEDTYIAKTFNRLEMVRELIPFSDEEYITINGVMCRNIYLFRDDLVSILETYNCPRFELIHGDCTFSNIMLDQDLNPILIDPRGYFGGTSLFGDPMYDWAKLYYSIVGNYDRFNLGDFILTINEDGVQLKIASNGWEDVESYFFEKTCANVKYIRIIHAVIWLSLTTYAWHDYDSICGAFYNGLYYLERALS